MKFRILLCLLLVACGTAPKQRRLSDSEIGMIIRVANLAEVREGEVAREKAADPAVRAFASMMVTEHSAASSKSEADLARADIAFEDTDLSRQIDASSGSATEALRGMTGQAFDRAYIARAIDAHKYILSLLDSTLLPSAHHKVVHNVLTEMRSTVEKHLTRAQQIQSALPR
jgi:putative membrane protein